MKTHPRINPKTGKMMKRTTTRNIPFIVKMIMYNKGSTRTYLKDYYIHRNNIDEYFKGGCNYCEIWSTVYTEKDGCIPFYRDEFLTLIKNDNKGSKIEKYIQENYPEYFI